MISGDVGKINLEALMNRANILFTSGYRFHGELDISCLEISFDAITSRVAKFRHQLDFRAQNDFDWRHAGDYGRSFRVIDADDLDEAFRELCRDSLSLLDSGGHCPMVLTVIRSRTDPQDFIIAQTNEHTYVDARSAETVLNLIVDHYNAQCRGDEAARQTALDGAGRMGTLSGSEMIEVLAASDCDHEANLAGLVAYPVADMGRYAIPLDTVPDCLDEYRKQRFAPIMRFFDTRALVGRCRASYPEVTQNAVICAALAKGFHDLNTAEGLAKPGHVVSFKMLSDLLKPELREVYNGNYIAFVPVSVDGSLPIEEMAKVVHDRIRHFKDSKLDVTIFKLTEEAVDAALVGLDNDPLSFVVTNWNNYRFLGAEEFLHGCRPVRHQSGVNIEPRDTLGAVLVNRPILVINMSGPDELCLSFFPHLRAEAENLAVSDRIAAVINGG